MTKAMPLVLSGPKEESRSRGTELSRRRQPFQCALPRIGLTREE